ncbi:hypothetical protein GQ44DRAFT_715624 [Phaeosphaeriaceae sp. PMI808]|nr:hypothetical protein GQ44DRAFT_715624 [Phaeosphaeriaceae sp. PMI808]
MEPLHDIHKMLLRTCPTSVTVSASRLERTAAGRNILKRCLWQSVQPENTPSINEWAIVDPDYTRQSILLPPKEFRGPVGAFQRIHYKSNRCFLQKASLDLLRIEETEKHYFAKEYRTFNCPTPACSAYFNQPGQWPAHAIEHRHYIDAEPPPEIAIRFAQQDQMLNDMLQRECKDVFERLASDWGAEGSDQRRIAEDAFLHQLQHDPLYARSKPRRESSIWTSYWLNMNRMHWF